MVCHFDKLASWKRTAILRLAILSYQSIVGWIIIIGLCRAALKLSLNGTAIVKKHTQSWRRKIVKLNCMRNIKLTTAMGYMSPESWISKNPKSRFNSDCQFRYVHFHRAQTRPPKIDQSKNTKIQPSIPTKICTEIIYQTIPAMLRLIVDDLAFTLYSFADSFFDNVYCNKGIIIVFFANTR